MQQHGFASDNNLPMLYLFHSMPTSCFTQILEELMHENDQAVHVVFLLAMAYHAGGDDSIALEYITEGETLITRLAIPSDDPSILGFQKLKVGSKFERLPFMLDWAETVGCMIFPNCQLLSETCSRIMDITSSKSGPYHDRTHTKGIKKSQ